MSGAAFRRNPRLLLVLGLALLLLPLFVAGNNATASVQAQGDPAPLNTGGTEYAKPGEVIVQIDRSKAGQGDAAIESAMDAAGLPAGQATPMQDPDYYLVKVDDGAERIASANLAGQDGVVQASPNYARYIFSIPNDSSFPMQWNLPTINLTRAWDTPQTQQVIVAVLDTGVDSTHPELRGRVVPGYDFVNNDDDPSDDQGHGTHVAGIIAAASNNDQGVAGIAWDALIMPIKVADSRGRIYSDAWINGLAYARQNGAKVANMSFGGANYSAAEQTAVSKAWDSGMVVVAASGNCGSGSAGCQSTNPLLYPAAYDDVISVGAVGDDLKRAYYSEYNNKVDVVAPGGDARLASDSPEHWILSLFPLGLNSNYQRGYGLNIGTSMASPHVAGLAALMYSTGNGWSNNAIEDRLKSSAFDLGPVGRDDEYGWGLINAAAAIAHPPDAAAPTATAISAPNAPIPTATATNAPPTAVPPTASYTPRPTSAPPTAVPPTASYTPRPVTNTPYPTATATPTSGPQKAVGFGCVFADVCQSDPFYPYVANLSRDGILSGYPDNTFHPLDRITRGEIARALVLSTGRAPYNAAAPHFSDVPTSSGAYSYIESIFAADIVSGYRDGTFRPDSSISRGQLVKMVVLAENWSLRAPVQASYADVPPGSIFFPYVETAIAHAVIAPDSAGFRPDDAATRAETARIVDLARHQ